MVRTISPKYGLARATRLIPPPACGVVLGFRLHGQAHDFAASAVSASAWSLASALVRLVFLGIRLRRRPSLTAVFLGQVVAPLDDHRLSLLEVGARDFHPAAVRRPRPRGWSTTVLPSRTTFRTGPSPRSRTAAAGTWSTPLRSSTMIDTRTDCPMVSRPCGVVDQDADRQVARLRVGHPADERDLAGHLLFLLGRGVGRRVAGVAVADAGGLPDAHRRGRPGRQPDRREDLPGIDHLADRAADGDRLAGVAVSGCRARRRSARGWCGSRDGPARRRPARRPS